MTEERRFGWGGKRGGLRDPCLYSSGGVMWIWVVPGPGDGATSER
jgi:hypothetical protein